jgi:hypothetical protein
LKVPFNRTKILCRVFVRTMPKKDTSQPKFQRTNYVRGKKT